MVSRHDASSVGKLPPEEWFLRRGVPSLLDGAEVGTDVRRRIVVPLVIVYLLLVAVTSDPSSLGSELVFAVIGLMVSWVLANLLRGRRPFRRITEIRPLELVLFVLVPPVLIAALVLLLGGFSREEQLLSSVGPLAFQLTALFAVWGLVWSGALSIITWLVRELTGSMGQVGVTIARTLPLLLGVVTFFFLAAEVWQSMGRIRPIAYVAVMLLFIALGGAFLSSRWQLDIDALARFDSREEIAELLAGTSVALSAPDAPEPTPDTGRPGVPVPLEGAAPLGGDRPAYEAPLGRRQRFNLRLVVALSKLAVATTVALGVFVFFVALGFLAVDAETAAAWIQAEPHVMWTGDLLGQSFVLTREHLKVAGFLAVFSGFYFSVVSATDAKLREGLRDTAEQAVREACAARVALLHSRPAVTDRP